jgi:hypothetical protein
LVDTQYLEQLIHESGLKKNYLSDKLGISRTYFRMKLSNKADFNSSEVDLLCKELSITRLTDKEKIFFKK